jgi:hypothetical protein
LWLRLLAAVIAVIACCARQPCPHGALLGRVRRLTLFTLLLLALLLSPFSFPAGKITLDQIILRKDFCKRVVHFV